MRIITQPMLAAKADLHLLRFPLLISEKLDGIRALAIKSKPMSRKMLVHPNMFIQSWFAARPWLDGYDGEIIVGSPTAPDVCRVSGSGCASHFGEPDFKYYVFDRWDLDIPFEDRCVMIDDGGDHRVVHVKSSWVHNRDELLAEEERILGLGYEGVILRDPKAYYKQGRSTVREGGMLKLKRFEDAEATIVGFEELMRNENEAVTDETGHTKRSSHAENLVPGGTLGALWCKGIGPFQGVEFKVSVTIPHKERDSMWSIRHILPGRTITYKYFNYGCKDKPRHPGFKTMRDDL